MTMLKYVTEPTTSKACLSYYYIRLLDTFQLYDNLVEDMMRLQEGALQDFETKRGHSLASEKKCEVKDVKDIQAKRRELKSILGFAKNRLRPHFKISHDGCNSVGVHCCCTV